MFINSKQSYFSRVSRGGPVRIDGGLDRRYMGKGSGGGCGCITLVIFIALIASFCERDGSDSALENNVEPTIEAAQMVATNAPVDPNDPIAYKNRGDTYHNLGQYERAIEDFDEAIRIDPDYSNAYSNRGAAYYNLGQYERAIEDFDEAIQIDPDYSNAYSNRGAAYYSLGQYERAFEDFDEAIRLDPDDGSALSNRSDACSYLTVAQKSQFGC